MTCHRSRVLTPAVVALLSGARALSFVRACEAALPVAAALYAAVFLACVAARLTFGFELSWMESGMRTERSPSICRCRYVFVSASVMLLLALVR